MREAVLLELTISLTPLSAYDVTQALTLRYGQKRHANSVYRALWALMETKDVILIASWRKFTIRPRGREPNAWLLCETCSTARPVNATEAVASLIQLANVHDFSPSKIVLEVRGMCRNC